MIDDDTINRMYPDASKEETEPDVTGVQTKTEQDEVLENLYPSSKEDESLVGNPYALEEDAGSVEDNLYGANERVELASDDDLTLIASTDEEKAQLKTNLGHIASLTGATQQDMSSLIETCNEHILTTQTFDESETMQSLYKQHGSDLSAKLVAAQTLVQSFPDLSEWLDTTGAGNNPRIINQIMQIAESPRSQERIRKLTRGK